MITEDYVSFETAKLLKEKGFDEYCKSVYHVGSVCSVASLGYHDNEGYGAVIDEKQNSDFGKYDNAISAPTIQMAMKWLREEHNLTIATYTTVDGWRSGVSRIKFNSEGFIMNITRAEAFDGIDNNNIPICDTYEEACEAAIRYCLENLI